MSSAQTTKRSVSILGLGAVGGRVAEILHQAGTNLTVWRATDQSVECVFSLCDRSPKNVVAEFVELDRD